MQSGVLPAHEPSAIRAEIQFARGNVASCEVVLRWSGSREIPRFEVLCRAIKGNEPLAIGTKGASTSEAKENANQIPLVSQGVVCAEVVQLGGICVFVGYREPTAVVTERRI